MRRLSLFLDPQPSARTPLGTPAAGGMALGATGIALAGYGLRRRGTVGAGLTIIGGALAYRGLTGMDAVRRLVDPRAMTRPFPALPGAAPIKDSGEPIVRRATTVSRSTDAISAVLRDPAAVAAVFHGGPVPWGPAARDQPLEGDRLRWRIGGRFGATATVDLDARTIEDDQTTWQVAGGLLRGTELRLSWRERAPGLGSELQASFGTADPSGTRLPPLVRDAVGTALTRVLARLASLVESGTLATVEGQTSGREDPAPPRFDFDGRPGKAGRSTARPALPADVPGTPVGAGS